MGRGIHVCAAMAVISALTPACGAHEHALPSVQTDAGSARDAPAVPNGARNSSTAISSDASAAGSPLRDAGAARGQHAEADGGAMDVDVNAIEYDCAETLECEHGMASVEDCVAMSKAQLEADRGAWSQFQRVVAGCVPRRACEYVKCVLAADAGP